MHEGKISVILLAGGIGSRMRASLPKQFMILHQKPVARYSFDLFSTLPSVVQIIVVCDPSFRHLFADFKGSFDIQFALPGIRRQDSLYNGLQYVDQNIDYVCIHDAARPLISRQTVLNVIEAAHLHGAATAAMPLKFTIKEVCDKHLVQKTLDRSRIWEIQTPQIIRADLLYAGFDKALKENLEVTDDVSLIENLPHPVKLVEGSYANLKITTPEDFFLAEHLTLRFLSS
jgi:2-C-methyl-D-erythritol 4-phosphate cytidylyltransferase